VKQLAGKTALLPALFQNDVCVRFEAAVLSALVPLLSGQTPAFLIALSGGADSSALAAAMASLRDKAAAESPQPLFSLYCLHVNHNLRCAGESANDEKASAALCQQLGIPFSVTAIPPNVIEAYAKKNGTGIEAAARHFRHAALRKEAQRLGVNAICIAHTASDRLETILMSFLRGSGPAGLGAMPGHSDQNTAQTENGGKNTANALPPIVRPLLSLYRADVLAYLTARNIAFCEDSTNTDQRYLRNKLRHSLIPFLDEHFNGWRNPVERLGVTQAITADFLKSEAARLLTWQTEKAGLWFWQKAALSANAEQFFLLPPILREEALYNAIDRLSPDSEDTRPRRDVLRSFIQGRQKAADLGVCRLEHKKDRVTVINAPRTGKTQKTGAPPPYDREFSVLIKRQGVYKLEGLTVKASLTQDRSTQKESGFFVFLPFVLRSSSGGRIFAEDRQGRAAMITARGLVQSDKRARERKPPDSVNQNGVYCTVLLNGGADAPGTE
jgi:tRNA(Ile)-lysidine synthase